MELENVVMIAIAVVLVAILIIFYTRKKRPRVNIVIPPVFMPPANELYLANMGGHSILGFKIGVSGGIGSSPVRKIQGPATGLHNPFDVAVDSAGRIWVANIGDPPGSGRSITVYDADANGNAAPVSIKNLSSGFDDEKNPLPGAIATRVHLVITDCLFDRVIEFTNTSGTLLSTTGIVGPQTRVINPTGIAIDQSQRIFVSVSSHPIIFGLYSVLNPPDSAILIFNVPHHHGLSALAPNAIISGNNTGLSNPAHICFDSQGNLYVVNRGTLNANINNTSITVYAAGQTGNIAPLRTISGNATQLHQHSNPYGIATDEDGRIFVSVQNAVLVFAAGANGNISPIHIINHPDISSPVGLAIR